MTVRAAIRAAVFALSVQAATITLTARIGDAVDAAIIVGGDYVDQDYVDQDYI